MKRTFMFTAAAVVWFALVLQFAIMVNVNLTSEDGSIAQAISRFLAYFTILSNILVATSFTTRLAVPHSTLGTFFARPIVETGIMMAIVTVGIIYVAVLQQTWNPQGLQLVADLLLHYFTPLAFLAYWLMFVPHGTAHWQHAFVWPIYPLAYAVYALIGGTITGFYPYPFIDVATFGYPRVLINVVVLLAGFVVGGLLVVVLDRALGRRAMRGQPRSAV